MLVCATNNLSYCESFSTANGYRRDFLFIEKFQYHCPHHLAYSECDHSFRIVVSFRRSFPITFPISMARRGDWQSALPCCPVNGLLCSYLSDSMHLLRSNLVGCLSFLCVERDVSKALPSPSHFSLLNTNFRKCR